MSQLSEYLLDLKQLEANLDKIIYNAILEKEGIILQKLKLRLFNRGVDGKGNKIQPEYTDVTIERKKRDGQRTSHVTLRDAGLFYASLYLEFTSNELFVDSSDEKYLLLAEKYGEDILGLNKDEQEFIILSIIEPEIIKELNKINNRTIDLF